MLCNSFAAHFLVPEDAFARAITGLPHDEAAAGHLAAFFHVSRETIIANSSIGVGSLRESIAARSMSGTRNVKRVAAAAITTGLKSPI